MSLSGWPAAKEIALEESRLLARPAERVDAAQDLLRRGDGEPHEGRHALEVVPAWQSAAELEVRDHRGIDPHLFPEPLLRLSRDRAQQPRHDVLSSHRALH